MTAEKLVFVGIIVTPRSLTDLSISSGYVIVENGKITGKGSEAEYHSLKEAGAFADFHHMVLNEHQFLMPGLVDCHLHAPQFPNIGLGLDRPLLEWLEKYTFPLESCYSNVHFARDIYDQVVQRLLNNGTTTACYFGSIHLEGTLELAKSVVKYCQRALVGKVSMNVRNNAGYFNSTETELKEVDTFVKEVLGYNNDLIEPIITPRFAVSCDAKLLRGLADLSDKYTCRIQSHISENIKEIEHVMSMNAGCKHYADVYEQSHILNSRCILAHGVHLTDAEISMLSTRGVSIAHCPASNTRLKSGLCPVRKLINSKLIVGLGTDVSGGDSSSMLDAMRRAMDVSMHLDLTGSSSTPALDWREALYLATAGGAKALNLSHKTGTLEMGKDFDALIVDVYPPAGGPIDEYPYAPDSAPEDAAVGLVQRFVHLGDDRNILQVFVKGQVVKDLINK